MNIIETADKLGILLSVPTLWAPDFSLRSSCAACTERLLEIIPYRNTEYTELQQLLSGVHSIMRVNLAQAGRGGDARPPPFITFTITSKVAVYAPAEWADTLTLFHI
jgi:hypothetical protein